MSSPTPGSIKANEDAAAICHRLLHGRDTIESVAKEYVCSPNTIGALFHRNTTPQQRQAARRRKIGLSKRGTAGGMWRLGKTGFPAPPSAFKPGAIRGAAARRYRAVGSVVVRKWEDGRQKRFIKISDDGPTHARWKAYAAWLWEREVGPIQPNHGIVYRDGDPMNDALENLRCVPRSEFFAVVNADPKRAKKRAERAAAAKRKQNEAKREYAVVRQAKAVADTLAIPKPSSPPAAPAGPRDKARARLSSFLAQLAEVA